MNIELADILTIVGAMGGMETIKWGIRAWRNRKTDARKEDAAADALEINNEKNQVTWLEERVTQRDMKIDSLYVELRSEQSARLEEIHKRHEAELALKDANHNRCDRPDSECGKRIPPRIRLNVNLKEEEKNENITG